MLALVKILSFPLLKKVVVQVMSPFTELQPKVYLRANLKF